MSHGVRGKEPILLIPKRLSWKRRLRYFYHRFVRLQGSPKTIARGIAAGVFAGWFPWFGFQILVAVTIATLVRGNKIAAAAATWVSNPLTYVPIFAFNFRVGQWLLQTGEEPADLGGLVSWDEVLEVGHEILVPLFFGCLVVGSFTALVSYLLGLRVVHRVRRNRRSMRKR